MTKRYLTFAGVTYYPYGGWSDFVGSFDDINEALLAVVESAPEWYEVVDTLSGDIWSGGVVTHKIAIGALPLSIEAVKKVSCETPINSELRKSASGKSKITDSAI